MAKCLNHILLLFFAATLSACSNSNYDFSAITTGGGSNNPQGGDQSCATQLEGMTVPVKIMLVVDQSGSNVSASGTIPASDPDKSVRAGSIQKFFNDYSHKGNFSWSLIGFHADQAKSFVGTSTKVFSNTPSEMQTAIDQFAQEADNGNTPYAMALNAAKTGIQSDTTRTAETKYVVVFISDGMPDPAISAEQAKTAVKSVTGVDPDQISFNAIYYGAANPSATSLMSQMATAGLGRFLDTNANPSGKTFSIGDVVYVPGCH